MENLWYNKNELRIYYGQLSLGKLKYFSRKCCEIYLHAILLTFDAQPPPKGHEVTQRTYNTHMFMFTIQTYTQIPNKNTKPLSNMQAVNIKRGHLGPNNNAFSLYPTTVKVHAELRQYKVLHIFTVWPYPLPQDSRISQICCRDS